MASAVSLGPRRWENSLSMTYNEPRLGALAFKSSDWPETPTVCSTPGVSRARASMRAIDPLGALHRRRIGQLHVQEQIPLVLLRDEARRGVVELPVRQHEQAAVDDQHERADPQHTGRRSGRRPRSSGRRGG